MKRCWFQDKDGSYFRNEGLVWREYETALRRGRWLLARKLHTEWREVWNEGLVKKDALNRRDKVVKMMPFRLAYPDKPGLWCLDDPDDYRARSSA